MCRYVFIFLIYLMFYSLFSCNEQGKKDLEKIVKEWNNKEIVFPNAPIFTKFAKDTVEDFFTKDCKYKVLTYIDSIGCLRCNLNLDAWKTFINLLQKSNSKCNVLLFIHPRSRRSVESLLKTEMFDYPVCIDLEDSINKLNHFPTQAQFQTLLLNKDNKVLAIGNPVLNPNIKDLYLKLIFGEDTVSHMFNTMTSIEFDKKSINMDRFHWQKEQTVDFLITNVGNYPLVIENVVTSCGCTKVIYTKEPIRTGMNLKFTVKYKAEYPEHFDKTITVFCNAKDSPFQLRIYGNAK